MMSRFVRSLNQGLENKRQPLETTVTFLEMTERPAERAPLPLNVHAMLIRAEKPPLHFYRYIYFQVGHKWEWESRLRWTDAKLRDKIHADTTEIYILTLDGAASGFFEVNRADPEVTDLAYFGMMEHASGRGLGRWFLSSAIHTCWDNDPQKITVNTCTLDHPAALPLYQKMGFQPVRQAHGRVHPLSASELAQLATKGIAPDRSGANDD